MSYAVIMNTNNPFREYNKWEPIRNDREPFDIVEFESFSAANDYIENAYRYPQILSYRECESRSYEIIKMEDAEKISFMESLIDGSDIDWGDCVCEVG